MRRITLCSLLFGLAVSGCFDDAVTVGLECENDLECGEGQACGPGVLEDNGSPTPDQVCGIPQEEGWDACQDTDPTTCGADFETALICRNGFRTETDCDVVCEAQVGGQRNDGVCGQLVPETNADCACAYAINEQPDSAKDCFQSDDGLELVRSTSFDSDDVAAYLQTCDEWCETQSEIPNYEGSVCGDTFVELAADAVGGLFATAVASRLADGQPCVCRLDEEPDCADGQPPTLCQGQNLVELCTDQVSAQVLCLNGCGSLVAGMPGTDWCL
ncbi:MAG: hypothetical protein ACRBN8_16515 [Nannocystales bacterium]